MPGVRKGCVAAFGAPDPTTGTERLVIVAESREGSRDARARIAQAITAQVSEAIGLPPNVVEVVPPNVIPKTSSGKLRRDATKQRFLAGELDSAAQPVWLQLARLGIASSAGRIRAALRRIAEIAYGCYALSTFALFLLPMWLLVLVSRSRESAARVTTAGLRAYLKLAGWRVRVEGWENLRENRPRMLVCNHTSYADIVVLMATLGTGYHFVAKAEVMAMPFFKTFLAQARAFFLSPRRSPRAPAAGGTNRRNAAPRRIGFCFPGRNFLRASRRASVSSWRIQGDHRCAAGDRAHRAGGNAARAARRHLAAAARAHHHHHLPAHRPSRVSGRLAKHRARARCGAEHHFPIRARTPSISFAFS